MIRRNPSIDGSSFLMGAVTGGALATGVALYFSPRLAGVRARLARSANEWRRAAASEVHAVENRVADTLDRAADVVDDVTARVEAARDDVATAVQRGAHAVSVGAREVERFARAAKTDQHERHG